MYVKTKYIEFNMILSIHYGKIILILKLLF